MFTVIKILIINFCKMTNYSPDDKHVSDVQDLNCSNAAHVNGEVQAGFYPFSPTTQVTRFNNYFYEIVNNLINKNDLQMFFK